MILSSEQSLANALNDPTAVPYRPALRPANSAKSMRTGAPRTIFRSGRFICTTIRCCTEPLRLEHVKPRLLGHWGTTPGLNFVYAHCNRLIKKYDLNMIYICGPGHGGPGMVANTYLEGTYSASCSPTSRRTPRA